MKSFNLNRIITSALLLLIALLSSNAIAVEQVTYYHNDATGSPVAATDNDGNLLWREEYRPYGARLTQDAAADTNSRWFTGKQEEKALGINYFGARWYSANAGRFMAVDPVGFTTQNIHSFNRYAYANNNPYRYVDPDGNIAFLALIPPAFELVGAFFTGYSIGTNVVAVAEGNKTVAGAIGGVAKEVAVDRVTRVVGAGSKAVQSVVPKVRESFKSKRAAFRAAKRDAGIPTSQTHTTHTPNLKADNLDTRRTATEYDFGGGRKVQNHPEGHTFSDGAVNKQAHFNNHGTGGTGGHFEYKK